MANTPRPGSLAYFASIYILLPASVNVYNVYGLLAGPGLLATKPSSIMRFNKYLTLLPGIPVLSEISLADSGRLEETSTRRIAILLCNPEALE
ncbi:MAG: hypothetical protein QXG48_02090 [Thermofilaceae archaeon]